MSLILNEKYRIIDPNGSSQTKVFLCEDLNEKKTVAIKSSSNKYSQDELELMKKFKCEFLVKLLDAFTVENPFVGRYYCIVMDYYQKGNLAKVISEKKRFNHEQIYEWSCEMIEAINYLHLNQIIHRNIKPSNIFQTNDEKHIKLADMKSEFIDVTVNHDEITSYSSPEMKAKQPYSFNTDVWSVGCVCYELLTFNTYDTNDQTETLEIFPNELNDLLKMMLVKDPKSRKDSKYLVSWKEKLNNQSCNFNDEYDVFLSYNWSSKAQVQCLDQKLKEIKLHVFRDERDLHKWCPLRSQLAQGINNSKLIICCVTRAYCTSFNCESEINWAVEMKKPLIVLMMENFDLKEKFQVAGYPHESAVPFIINQYVRINCYESIDDLYVKKFPEIQNSINDILQKNKKKIILKEPINEIPSLAQISPSTQSSIDPPFKTHKNPNHAGLNDSIILNKPHLKRNNYKDSFSNLSTRSEPPQLKKYEGKTTKQNLLNKIFNSGSSIFMNSKKSQVSRSLSFSSQNSSSTISSEGNDSKLGSKSDLGMKQQRAFKIKTYANLFNDSYEFEECLKKSRGRDFNLKDSLEKKFSRKKLVDSDIISSLMRNMDKRPEAFSESIIKSYNCVFNITWLANNSGGMATSYHAVAVLQELNKELPAEHLTSFGFILFFKNLESTDS